MSLTKKFEWYTGAAKDAAQNLGDMVVTGQKTQGLCMAGLGADAKREGEALNERIAARKAARLANKPA